MKNLNVRWCSLLKQLAITKLMKLFYILLIPVYFSGFFNNSEAQQANYVDVNKPDTRIIFLFDASQSMYGSWESDIKYEVARKLMNHIADSIDRLNHVQMALRVYGHTKKFPPQDCDDNRLEVPFGHRNGIDIKKRLSEIM